MASSSNHESDSTFVEYKEKIDKKIKEGYAAVHLWNYVSVTSVGHLSLTLSDGTHISFWPNFEKRLCLNFIFKKTGESKSLIQDMNEEKRIPDETLYIPIVKLSEEKIKNWWMVEKSKGYNLLNRNCAYTVIKALIKGEFLKIQKIIENSVDNKEFKIVLRHGERFEGADELLKEYKSIRDSIKKEEPNWSNIHIPKRTFDWINKCNKLFPKIKYIHSGNNDFHGENVLEVFGNLPNLEYLECYNCSTVPAE